MITTLWLQQTVLQPVMGAVIQALTGSTNRDEVSVMAKQATEVASLVISLAQALATSMSQVTHTTVQTASILLDTGQFSVSS